MATKKIAFVGLPERGCSVLNAGETKSSSANTKRIRVALKNSAFQVDTKPSKPANNTMLPMAGD